jgi:TolB protein
MALAQSSALAETAAAPPAAASTADADVSTPATTPSASDSSDGTPSQVQIDVTEAKTRKSLLAFPALQASEGASKPNVIKVGEDLAKIISDDLGLTGYFQFIAPAAFLEDPTKTDVRPISDTPKGFKFDSWKQIGAEFLIRGTYSVSGEDVSMETFVYKVDSASVVLAKKYKGTTAAVRRIAHTFANDLMQALTGNKGMFLSRIVATSDRGGDKFKEVYIMDWDGSNVSKVSDHQSVTLSPTWSPDGSKIAYTAFVQRAKTKTRNADMYMYEVASGKRWPISFREGLNSGANFDASGNYLFVTLSKGGSPDIYKMSVDGKELTQITKGPRGAMNVEPAISPDSSKIAFSSDRGGNPMIYIMNADGSDVKRLTFAGTNNAAPSWSPDGRRLAFATWQNEHFDIMTISADGGELKRITSVRKKDGKWAQNESPSFSPDGRFLVYTSNRTGSYQIYISNLDGSEETRITHDDANYFSPKWSRNIE